MAHWTITPTQEMTSKVSGSVQDGDTMELMVTFKVEGKDWCITEIEGSKTPGYGEKSSDKKEGGKVGEAYQSAMKGAPNGTA